MINCLLGNKLRWRALDLDSKAAPINMAPPQTTRGRGKFPVGYLIRLCLPAVSTHFGRKSKKLFTNSLYDQVSPTRQPLGWATLLPRLGRSPTKGDETRTYDNTTTWAGTSFPAPKPNASLVARLSAGSAKAILNRDKPSNMKSVEATPKKFTSRFSGSLSEDWLGHVDLLETERARMHSWTPEEFYYGLRTTLTGKALETLRALEEDMEVHSFRDLIPSWFEPEGGEWRKICNDAASFSTLSARTQIAIMLEYFHRRFQVRSPDQAYTAFKMSAQRSDESLEDWGKRLDRAVAKVQRFGRDITFGELLKKYRTGTKTVNFCEDLQDAILSRDPSVRPLLRTINPSWHGEPDTKNARLILGGSVGNDLRCSR